MQVDENDIPTLIQGIKYNYGEMAFKVLFFTGAIRMFPTDFACPSISLVQKNPSRMQWLEAQNNIEKYAIKNWAAIND